MDIFHYKLKKTKIIAILRGLKNTYDLLKLAEALYKGGISLIEITIDQSDYAKLEETADLISKINNEFNSDIIIGAGTVLTLSQLEVVASAGAKFIISPGVNERVVKKARKLGLISIPGAMTPTELISANNSGADLVKVFPAGALGPEFIKSIRAPLSHIDMIAVGGINLDNAREFIEAGAIGVGIGGMLVNKTWIEAKEFSKIAFIANEFVKKICGV